LKVLRFGKTRFAEVQITPSQWTTGKAVPFKMDKLKRALRGNDGGGAGEDEERGIIDEALDASTLSWSTRVKGFIACFVLGCVISILSTVLFAVTYSLVATYARILFGKFFRLKNWLRSGAQNTAISMPKWIAGFKIRAIFRQSLPK
jgi:hypothetical protein